MHRRATRSAVGAACLVITGIAVALVAPTASASVTVGSSLASTDNADLGCPLTGCTYAQQGVTVPLSGVITQWGVRSGNPSTFTLRVLRSSDGGATWSAAATSAPGLNDGSNTPRFFPARVPVSAGDQIGVSEVPQPPAGNNGPIHGGNPGTMFYWNSVLTDGGGPSGPTLTPTTIELLLQASIEADADCDGFGDETQDGLLSGGCLPTKAATLKGGKAKGKKLALQFGCGLAGGNCDRNKVVLKTAKPVKLRRAIASAAQKKGARRITLGRAAFSIPAGQTLLVRARLTKQALKLFKARGKVKARATITGGGASSTAALKIKAKRKKRH